ncbi:MAG: FecR family protein [Sphingomonadales bacterium]
MTDKVTEEAIAWHFAQQRDDADWDAFARWLEADPSHRDAYDAVALLDDSIDRHRATLATILADEGEQVAGPRRGLGRFGMRIAAAGSAAAAIAAALLVTIQPTQPPAASIYVTGLNQSRSIALADGSTIQLASSSRLEVAGAKQDDLTLRGAAAFSIPHREGRTLVVHAAGVDLKDIGTKFDVATGPATVRVAVAEGRLVALLPDRERVQIGEGKRLLVDLRSGVADLRSFAVEDFASWRSGRLVYEDVPLALVAADISRYSGTKVVVDPELSGRRFSGVLTIGDGSQLVRNLVSFMGLQARPEGKSVRVVARSGT